MRKVKVSLLISTLIISTILNIFSGCQIEYDKSEESLKIKQSEIKLPSPDEWKEVSPGITYKEFFIKTSEEKDPNNLIFVQIDTQQYKFSIYENKEQESAKTIEEIHNEQKSLLTFNGQFFSEDFKPLGLLISEGEKIRGLSHTDLMNGVIAINDDGIVKFFDSPDEFDEKNYDFAIQNGPILIDSNKNIRITKDTGKKASRTAIGIDAKGNLILIILKQSVLNFDNKLSLYNFAHMLQETPELQEFKLKSVINLDGGPSTGLMIDNKYYPEMAKVQNVVLVKKQ